jgi:hypothetical protein
LYPYTWEKVSHSGLKSDYIKCFARDREHIYFGTSRGLYIKNKKKTEISQFVPLGSIFITSIYPAENNIIWIGTYDGIYKVDLDAFKIVAHYTKSGEASMDGTPSKGGLSSDSIVSIAGNDEFIFAGNESWGINIINKKTEEVLQEKITGIELPSQKINHILVTPALIIVSTRKGVGWKMRWDSMWEEIPETSSAYGLNVRQCAYRDNKLFLATDGDGVLEVNMNNPDEVKKHDRQGGMLQSDYVFGLFIDGEYLWASTFDGLSVYSFSTDAWKKITRFSTETLDKVFVDGTYVYVSTDGGGVFSADKFVPEIQFFPEIKYKNGSMQIIGAVVSKYPVKAVKSDAIFYRDVEMEGDFTSEGITSYINGKENIFHNRIAEISYADRDLPGKIWRYEVKLQVSDVKGNKNSAATLFMYDSLPPKLDLIGISDGPIQYTRDNKFSVSGKVREYKLKEFTYTIGEQIKNIQSDKRGNFKTTIHLSEETNIIEFSVLDMCDNQTTKKVNIIYDNIVPSLKNKKEQYEITSEEEMLTLTYVEKYLKWGRIFVENSEQPVECTIDTVLSTVSFPVAKKEKGTAVKLELGDFAGNSSSAQFSVVLNNSKPVFKLTGSEGDFLSGEKIFTFKGRVLWNGALKLSLFYKGKALPLSFDSSHKTFQATVNLIPGQNIYTLKADVDNGEGVEKMISVYYERAENNEKPIGTVSASPAEVVRLQKEIALLKKEIMRLKKNTGKTVKKNAEPDKRTVDTGKRDTRVVIRKAKPSSFTLYPALKIVSFTGTLNYYALAKKYMGASKYAEVLELLNGDIPSEQLKSKGNVVIPNFKLLGMMTSEENNSFYYLIRSLAYTLFSSSGTGKPNQTEFIQILKKKCQKNLAFISIKKIRNGYRVSQKTRQSGVYSFKTIILKLENDGVLSVTYT